jgi:uncharacterized protein with GYD domain
MPTYMVLFRFTDQGVRNIKDTLDRERKLLQAAERSELHIKALYYLRGEYDLVALVEAPDDRIMQAAEYAVRSQGNVTFTSCRAFSPEEMEGILDLLP